MKDLLILFIGIIIGFVFTIAFKAYAKKPISEKYQIKDDHRIIVEVFRWEESTKGHYILNIWPPIPEKEQPQWLKELKASVDNIPEMIVK